jgi:hypothetical protein
MKDTLSDYFGVSQEAISTELIEEGEILSLLEKSLDGDEGAY